MIIQRFRRGQKAVTWKTTAPRSLGVNIRTAARQAQSVTFIAASNFESALMNGDIAEAGKIQHAATRDWLREHGAFCANLIRRPVKRITAAA